MHTLNEALDVISRSARSFGREEVALDDALGRVLAEPVVADRDYPPFHRSAMDGIAIRYADFEQGMREFRVVETIYAGSESKETLCVGECYKIMTGAAVPVSASAVIRKEELSWSGTIAEVRSIHCQPFQHIALRGQDLLMGEEVLRPSVVITPSLISLLATVGKAEVLVERQPKVALFTTGNEVVSVSDRPSNVQIRNSNGHLMKALLLKNGIKAASCEHVGDRKDALTSAFQSRLSADILVVSGGVSAGDEDFVPEVLEALGVSELFHHVAIKPGKPVWCGKMPGGPMVFALPGNPFACLVTFKLFVESFIQCSYGLGMPSAEQFSLGTGHSKKTRFDEFFPVGVSCSGPEMQPVVSNGSGDIRLGMLADAFALHSAKAGDLESGAEVDVYLV